MATNASQVRERISIAKSLNEDPSIVVQWAVDTLNMKNGLAKAYVKNLWNETTKTLTPIEQPTFITPMRGSFNSLLEVKTYLESINIPIESFNGHTIYSGIGKIGMAFGEISINQGGTKIVVRTAAEFKQFVTN
jgi:hypothetical protein